MGTPLLGVKFAKGRWSPPRPPTPCYFWFTMTSAGAPSPSQEPLGWRERGARHAPPVTFKAGAAHSPRAAAPSHPGPQAP